LFPAFEQFDAEEVTRMLTLLRLSVLLNQKRQNDILPNYTLKCEGNRISLKFAKNWLKNKPVFSADLTREAHWLRLINIDLQLS
jgi:exopolyphosphatase/guanosine-5'-triphosphate,3'-diphosphate pyrophosphatase